MLKYFLKVTRFIGKIRSAYIEWRRSAHGNQEYNSDYVRELDTDSENIWAKIKLIGTYTVY